MTIAVITALLGLPTGLAAGWLVSQLLRGPRGVVAPAPHDAPGVLQFGRRVHSLTQRVQGEVSRHQAGLAAAHAELRDSGPANPVVERILGDNEHLLEQLADAEEQFVQQEFEMQQYMREASHDALTSLENRRAFDKDLAERFVRWHAHGAEFCLAMLDVDHFKRINDEYGHPTGDDVLKALAGTLAACAREADLVSRLGGEEFAVLLADCSLDQGRGIADRLRSSIADHAVATRGGALSVTVSIGLASVRSVPTPADLVHHADQALYSAKKAGRNRSYHYSGAGYDPVLPAATSSSPSPALNSEKHATARLA